MYAVVNHPQFDRSVNSFRDSVHSEGIPLLSGHEGFIDFHFVKLDEFNAIVIVIREDAASAQAGAKSFGPSWFATNFRPFLAGDENRSTGEIIASSYKK